MFGRIAKSSVKLGRDEARLALLQRHTKLGTLDEMNWASLRTMGSVSDCETLANMRWSLQLVDHRYRIVLN
jgi:hypothetical protein